MIADSVSSLIEEKITYYDYYRDNFEYKNWRNQRFKNSAIQYASLRDFGTIHNNLNQKKASKVFDDVSLFFEKNKEYNKNLIRHNLFEYAINHPDRFQKFKRNIVRSFALPPNILSSYDKFWNRRSHHLMSVLERLPAPIVQYDGINKFFRTFFGCVYFFQFWNKNKNISQEFLDISYLYSLSFLLLDGYFDSPELCPKQFWPFVYKIMKSELNDKNDINHTKIPSDLFNLFVCLLDELREHKLFKDNLCSLTEFLESQFDENKNYRLMASGNIDNIIFSSGNQAYLSRYCAHKIAGAAETALNKKALFQSSIINQMSNDIEGYVADKNHFQTIPNHNIFSKFTISSFIEEAEKLYQYQVCDSQTFNEIISLRLLETFRETCPRMSRDDFRRQLEYWNSCGEKSIHHDAIIAIAKYRSIFLRLHREDFAVKNIAQSARRARIKYRNERSIGQRRLWLMQDRYLISLERTIDNEPLSKTAKFSLTGNAQRIRPLIFFMYLKENNNIDNDVMQCALGIELFHSASLVIDDLPSQDNASVRRNRKSSHEQFTVHEAELSSFELIGRAFENFSKIKNLKVSNKLISLSSNYFSGVHGVNRGQNDDIFSRRKAKISKFQYIRIISRKTGLGFSFPILAAAYFNGDVISVDLVRTSKNIGMLYQVADDIQDQDVKLSKFELSSLYMELKTKIVSSKIYSDEPRMKAIFEVVLKNCEAKFQSSLLDIPTNYS